MSRQGLDNNGQKDNEQEFLRWLTKHNNGTFKMNNNEKWKWNCWWPIQIIVEENDYLSNLSKDYELQKFVYQ